MFPFNPSVDTGFFTSSTSSGSSKNSNILSAAAIIDCIVLDICATWPIGCVNCLLYCIKLCILPTVILPFTAKYPPKIATATYPTFPTKFINGCIKPDKNCERHPDLYNSSFSFSNSFIACSSLPKTLTILCPPYTSST